MSLSDTEVQYWKNRFARERAEEKAAQEADLESLRNEFNQKLEKLHNENKELRERPVVVEERNGGFMAFAVGCAIGLLIGG